MASGAGNWLGSPFFGTARSLMGMKREPGMWPALYTLRLPPT